MPFWIKVEVNEETVSVLLTRWMEGGVMISEYHVPDFFFFFSVFPFYRIFLVCSPVSGAFQKLAHAWRWRFPVSSRGRTQFNFFVFILDRISPRRNCCEIMAQKEASKQISIPQKGFIQWKLLNFCYNQRLSSKPRVGFSSSAYAVTRNLFAPNLFGRKAFLADHFFIYWNFSLLLDYFYNAKGKVRTLLLIHLTL